MTEEEFREKEAEKEQQKQENQHNAQNNAKALRVAATVAENSGEPHAVVVGKIVNTADKITGGKSTELLGHVVNHSLKHQPFGKQAQKGINKLGDSGITDLAGKAISQQGGTPQNKAPTTNANTPAPSSTPNNQKAPSNKQHTNNRNTPPTTKPTSASSNTSSTEGEKGSSKSEGAPGCLVVGLMGGIFSVVPIILLLAFFSIVAAVIAFFIDGSSNEILIASNGYYRARCDEITVISKKDGIPSIETYELENYVAGVVAAELGTSFADQELYKSLSIAARTFVLKYADSNCIIESSSNTQNHVDINKVSGVDLIIQAAEETEGKVLLSSGELYPIQYDAFCYKDKDSNYYTLSQKEQKIPVSWAEKNVWSKDYLNCPCELKETNMTQCWDSNGNWSDGGHGRGMSQYGAYYLATEEGYKYDEILKYYYGEEIQISSSTFMTSIAGLEIKDTTNATALNEPITSFLSSKGSSLDDLNNFVYKSVQENGPGTREGVVTAAVSMINYLYDNFNTKLPYYWGGKVYSGAIPASFGTYSPSEVSRGGNISYYKSFDCSGFVSWSIRNGGYNFTEQSTAGFDSNYSKNSCNIIDSNCIGQPGDLINSRSGHVELIIAVDEINNKYFVAESGGPGVVMRQRDMHKGNSSKNVTKIIFMEEFYSNPSNVNLNY